MQLLPLNVVVHSYTYCIPKTVLPGSPLLDANIDNLKIDKPFHKAYILSIFGYARIYNTENGIKICKTTALSAVSLL